MSLLGVAWSNIVVGVASALLVGAAVWGKDRLYDRYLEYKYPIAGRYVTEFEDEADGEQFVATAPATLEQRGRQVEGKTVMPNDDREWMIEGKISDGGYLNGIYYATDPHDSGVGNFFLYIGHDRRMEGLWSGYDEINQKISSGKYVFTPTFDAFDVEHLEASSVPAAIDLADQRLGTGYLDPELLERSLDDDSPYFTRVASVNPSFESDESLADRLADAILDRGPAVEPEGTTVRSELDSRLVGFCLSGVFSIDELEAYLNVGADELPTGVRHAERIGVIRTVAVREGFESQGVGTRLVGDGIDECFSRGATALCVVGWREDGRVNIEGIVDHFNFERAGEYEEYWRDESVEVGYSCENCGEPPCTCSAVLFTRYR